MSTAKVVEHIPSGCSISTTLSFKNMKNKRDVYRDKDCIKKLYESLKYHTKEIIDFVIIFGDN